MQLKNGDIMKNLTYICTILSLFFATNSNQAYAAEFSEETTDQEPSRFQIIQRLNQEDLRSDILLEKTHTEKSEKSLQELKQGIIEDLSNICSVLTRYLTEDRASVEAHLAAFETNIDRQEEIRRDPSKYFYIKELERSISVYIKKIEYFSEIPSLARQLFDFVDFLNQHDKPILESAQRGQTSMLIYKKIPGVGITIEGEGELLLTCTITGSDNDQYFNNRSKFIGINIFPKLTQEINDKINDNTLLIAELSNNNIDYSRLLEKFNKEHMKMFNENPFTLPAALDEYEQYSSKCSIAIQYAHPLLNKDHYYSSCTSLADSERKLNKILYKQPKPSSGWQHPSFCPSQFRYAEQLLECDECLIKRLSLIEQNLVHCIFLIIDSDRSVSEV